MPTFFISSILSIPCCNSAAANVIFLVVISIPLFLQQCALQGTFYCRRKQYIWLLSFHFIHYIPLLLVSIYYYFIPHAIVPNDLLHLSPAPRFKPFQVFIIYLPKGLTFSTIKEDVVNVAHYCFILRYTSNCLVKWSSLFECCSREGNPGLNFRCIS